MLTPQRLAKLIEYIPFIFFFSKPIPFPLPHITTPKSSSHSSVLCDYTLLGKRVWWANAGYQDAQRLRNSVLPFGTVYTVYSSNWRRQWHSTPVFLPGKSHGQRSLVGCSPWGRRESDVTEWPHFHFSLPCIGEGNGNPLQCSCLENPRDGGAWWAAVYGVAQSRTRLKQLSSSSILLTNVPYFKSEVFFFLSLRRNQTKLCKAK